MSYRPDDAFETLGILVAAGVIVVVALVAGVTLSGVGP